MSKAGADESMLESLAVESRKVATEFLRVLKSAGPSSGTLELSSYVDRVPVPQQAQLRQMLEKFVERGRGKDQSVLSADTTLLDGGLGSSITTQASVADLTAHDATERVGRAPPSRDTPPPRRPSDSRSDETIDLPQAMTEESPSDMTVALPNESAGTSQWDMDFDSTPASDASLSDVTINLDTSSSGSEMAATIDPTTTTPDSDEDGHFTWDPAGSNEGPVGNLPPFEGYQILGELGRGGMGVVYRARHRSLKRIVALKMILAGGHAGAEQLARFRAEAEAVAQLQHPNIVQIYDVGERDGLPFFALEFIGGQPLDQLIDGQPQVPTRAAAIVEQLARAMDYAHDQGIVHRDLKPANILLTEYGIPKVTDFGLVKRLEGDSSQTRTGTIMGTPSYMAPEQARGEREIGPAADTYALGSILYTMLTGRPPFMGPTALDTLMMVIRSEPVPPSKMQPKLPRDIEIICLKCLQKSAEKRYASAGELAEDLRRFQAGELILARPVGTTERIWRWCRRNPRVAILTTAALLLASVLMIGGPAAAILINSQRQAAILARAAAEKNAQAARIAEDEAVVAQEAAESARAVADENAGIATTQRQLALETLSNVVTQVEEELRDRTELSDLRQNVLKLAMDGLENVSRTSETASFADRTIGAAHQRMGDILLRAGKATDAREQYNKALAIFEKLMDAPESDLVQWNAALTHDGLGDVGRKQLEDENATLGHYEKALAYRKTLETSATSPKLKPFMIRASLANSYGRISLLLLELTGQPAAASSYSEMAIEQSTSLLADLPDHPIPKQALAGAWNLHADAILRTGHSDEARDYAQRAMNLRQELLIATPESVKARQDVAISNWTLGDIALFTGNPSQALDYYQAAHSIRLDLYEDDQENPEMQEDLSTSYYKLGTAQLSSEQSAHAQQSFEECRQLREAVLATDPENRTKQLQLLIARARCGEGAAVLDRADQLRSSLFPTAGTLVRLAGIYATCSASDKTSDPATSTSVTSAESIRKVALDLIDQAVERGYRDSFMLAVDPDLASIRSDAEFSQLLQRASPSSSDQ